MYVNFIYNEANVAGISIRLEGLGPPIQSSWQAAEPL